MTLNNIAWSFSKKSYQDPEIFNQEVSTYQKEIRDTDAAWHPDEIVFNVPELNIQYEAWISKAEDLLDNETLIDEEDVFDEDNSEDGMFQVEIVARLQADNGKHFTASEFLRKAHNQQVNKALGDHVFFEGTDEDPAIIDGLLLCYIACGS
ncbi:MAG: hypothetical protein EOP54_03690 [Sphingobacteriales bacterium]|nr:MAG: hypothetical protein EOP54_03690 [Sphingobacteriales bacterium]